MSSTLSPNFSHSVFTSANIMNDAWFTVDDEKCALMPLTARTENSLKCSMTMTLLKTLTKLKWNEVWFSSSAKGHAS